jgi:hypothetical protein
MLRIKEAIIEAVLPIIKASGKAEINTVLSSIKIRNKKEVYKNTLQGLYSCFSLMKEAADQTKTRIDDGIIDIILEVVMEKAKEDDVVLLN